MKTEPTALQLSLAKAPHEISPTLYGLFFEDINYGADGGLYGELLKNRSFEFFSLDGSVDKRLWGWELVGKAPEVELSLQTETPLSPTHRNYLRLSRATKGAPAGVRNLGNLDEGFAVRSGESYRFSVWARTFGGPFRLSASIEASAAGPVLGSATVVVEGSDWRHYEAVLTASGTETNAVLLVATGDSGRLDLDLVSLFPVNTFGQRRNGLRADLAQMLKDLKPGFLRFPGGCIVEGRSFENMYRWKETIGDLKDRRTNWNRWQLKEHQRSPEASSEDYFQSYGLGFFEYFLLCEDLGAEPVPVVNVGMTCQFHEALLIPMAELDEFIQDALDLIEFCNGGPTSPWGRVRAELGHPEPFHLKYLGVGNEQWDEVYFERYEAFHRAIKARYPAIQLITGSGPFVDEEKFFKAQKWLAETSCRAEIVDEHYYRSPEWFVENIHRYDTYDRRLPKVFAGEYAAHTARLVEDRRCNWRAAIAEAALLTGIERNCDHVVMSCYAPLFARTGHYQWGPDLIWFNNAEVFGTPSYYVQKLFSGHRGRWLAAAQVTGLSGDPESFQVVTSLAANRSEVIVKVVNLSTEAVSTTVSWAGPGTLTGRGTAEVLHSADLEAENSHAEPFRVSPRTEVIQRDGAVTWTFEGQSVTVLRLGLLS